MNDDMRLAALLTLATRHDVVAFQLARDGNLHDAEEARQHSGSIWEAIAGRARAQPTGQDGAA